ncbi:ASG_G0006230.mRNA.1.CDS.1 [Saccharomyces cerevisiae]|uniref:Guanine nucleotide-exchange factor SEC12 n=2 Tax=Saccharomyces cerevisiae TaxID=4932 RepID=C7GUX8_YEAS2|nr:Sed4p [Saccharomyces cerevisiae YJM1078]AJQ32410.1 Sed4p [Saccharomyces cerevisiae YJM1385]AJQ33859.1 Sed4p [Saccharomyces cerevisiae YJM1417]AJQ35183.1 Sed4p [Saccharomyces cerevisiae YJM1450]AJQ36203.1 Sed4p [Saccharomyces cerevisiae YJM555]AJQ36932.1 Sed4p [Saccharomyces cerevisiae YJM689]AJQ38835.1 Sed4p [Saccharomyces cerevisiae YJM1133]AJQ39546.1 Sed4p [Saccharomyces cerevisiae YJM1242]AJQ39991.1 Sed4p [Saccharomyces cerevisiae YJM1250]AJQ40139.1 Sed4p [Saccharomyces cerevisiae YJ
MSGNSANYDVGYPIYGAKFINEGTLLVAGGGGQFNSSFPNKITALKVNFQKKKHIRRFREITLDSIDDAPTSLDCNNNLILVGCNELFNDSSMENVNHHLRKFVFEQEHLKFVASIDFNRTTDPSVFTKFVYINQRATVAAIASSEVPTVIRIIDPRNLTENYEIETGREVNDLHFAPNGILLSYITSNSLEVASVRDGNFVARKTDFDKNLVLSNIRFLNDNTLLVAASLSNSDGVSLLKLGVSSKGVKILKTASFMFDLNGITSMDVSPNKKFVALSSNDNSVAIVSVEKLKLVQLVPRVHESTITKVTFSPDSRYLASTSMGNTINVLKLSGTSSSILRNIWKFFLNFVLLVVLAGAIQLGYKHNVHGFIYKHAHDIYKSKFKENTTIDQGSSSYFTINDDYRGITESADIISATDVASDIETEFSSFDTSTMRTTTEDEQKFVWISSSADSQFTSADIPTSASSSSSSSSSSFYEESVTNEPIVSSPTSEITKPLASPTEPNIVEKPSLPLNSESIDLLSSSSNSITEYPEPTPDLEEKLSSLIVEQSESEITTDRESVSKLLSTESPSLSHMPSSSSSSLSLSSSSTTSPTTALSTSTATAVTTTQTNPTNDAANTSFLDNSKPASTREIYKTKIITEVITKIEYRNIPASDSNAEAEQYVTTSSSMLLTPTDTMVSSPVSEIDPIASELERMVETPTHSISIASEFDSVASNLIPNEEILSTSASQDSISSHPSTFSDSSITSGFQSIEVSTVTSSVLASESIPSISDSTFSKFHSISEPVSSAIVETATSSFSKTETKTSRVIAFSTEDSERSSALIDNSEYTSVLADNLEPTSVLADNSEPTSVLADSSEPTSVFTDAVQSPKTSVGQSSLSESTNIEGTSMASMIFSSSGASIGALSDIGKGTLSVESASSTVAQPMPGVTTTAPSFVSSPHKISASSIDASGFVQKEIMIEVQSSKDSSEAFGVRHKISENVNTPVSRMLTTEMQASGTVDVTEDVSLSSEVISALNVEITSLPNPVAPPQTIAAPLNNNSNTNIVNDDNAVAGTVNYAGLHDEL